MTSPHAQSIPREALGLGQPFRVIPDLRFSGDGSPLLHVGSSGVAPRTGRGWDYQKAHTFAYLAADNQPLELQLGLLTRTPTSGITKGLLSNPEV